LKSGIEIRQIQESDIRGYYEALCEVVSERLYLGFLDPPPYDGTQAFVRENLASENSHFVAVDTAANRVVGWCDICQSSTRVLFAHIGHLGTGIVASHRGLGIGRQLIRSTREHAIFRGLTRIELEVYCSNERAIKLYLSEGFQIEGTKRAHARFPDRVEDSHLMAYLAPTKP
jgi:putative acetyltransferase